jgi:hypothetical protein
MSLREDCKSKPSAAEEETEEVKEVKEVKDA